MRKGKIDYPLLIAVLLLVIIGLTFVYTASSAKAAERFDGDSAYFLKMQSIRVIIGLIAMAMVMRVDYHTWIRRAPVFYWLILTVLLFMLFMPSSWMIRGTRRWIDLGLVKLQPSEFAKYALIFMLAKLLSKRDLDIKQFVDGLLPQLILIGLICGAILPEPDAGSALMIFFIALTLLFTAGARIVHLFNVLSAGALMVFAGLMVNAYQRERLFSFIASLRNEGEVGWQVKQSLISLGNGGVFGVGLGQSRQKMHWLPDPFTDFIFSIIGEELGLIGTLGIVALFVFIIYRGFRIALNAPDPEGRYLAVGITTAIGLYAFMNMAVITHLVPTTGIPMPFVSYGGSSLITHLAAVGMLLNISYQSSMRYVKSRYGVRHASQRYF